MKSTFLVITLILSLCIIGCQKEKAATIQPPPAAEQKAPVVAAEKPKPIEPAKQPAAEAKPAAKITPENAAAIIEMAKGGRIVMEFYPKDAPNTVSNFIKLADKGFYNGLKFHRVVKQPNGLQIVQGGDPLGNGTGGPGYNIKAEFNSQKHLAGSVAMARADDPDSAGSQFYICLAPQPFLDNSYTVFGQVISGLEVANGVKEGDVMKKVTIVDKASLKK